MTPTDHLVDPRRARLSVPLAAVSGLLLVVAFPPLDGGIAAVAAVTGFLLSVWIAPSAVRAALAGLAFGLVFFGVLLRWVLTLGTIAWLPLVVTQTLFLVGLAWWIWTRRTQPTLRLVADTAAAWIIVEFLRSWFPVGGFPWGAVGYSVGGFQPARSAARWIGVYGWSAVLVGVAATLALLVLGRRQQRQLLVAPLLAFALLVGGAVVGSDVGEGELTVAIVQGENPCPGTKCPNERTLVYESHLELTRSLEPGAHDLVVWAESSTGFGSDPIANPEVGSEIGKEAERLDATILVGADRGVDAEQFINANLIFGPDGSVIGEYRKTHPVPFGEYIPARPLFEWIPDLDQVPRDMVRGDGPVVVPVNGGSLGSVISYEAAYGRYMRAAVSEGAQLIVVATNQSSYGPEASPQLIGMTRMHAAALGVDVVHSAVTGRSTIIRSDGTLLEPTGFFEATVLTGVASFATSRTLYARLGEWTLVLALGWLALGALTRRQRSGDHLGSTEPGPAGS